MAKNYYIRNNNSVTGPFPESQIKSMMIKNILNSNAMISWDRVEWYKAADVFIPAVPDEPETVYFKMPPKVAIVEPPVVEEPVEVIEEVEEEEVEIEVEEEEEPVEEEEMPDFLPDPVCLTFSMLWNAPKYLREMRFLRSMADEDDNPMKFSIFTIVLSVLLECLLAGVLFYMVDKKLCIAGVTSMFLTVVCTLLLLILENLCLSAMAKQKSMIDNSVLFMQVNIFAAAAFISGMPLAGLLINANVGAILKAVCIIFAALSGTACIINLGAGIYYAARNIFKFRNSGGIFCVILNILLWFIMLLSGYKLAAVLKISLFES